MNVAWHFVRLENGAPVLRDGRVMPGVGAWLEETGDIIICERGLHASWRAFDALGYAHPVPLPLAACLVEVEDIVAEHTDKLVCRRRKVLAWAPCDDVLRLFAREAALSVLHLWQSEVPAVVREYLETGNEAIMAAGRDAAGRDAALAAAWAAALAAGRAAGRDAAGRDAAWAAARAAAWDAAGRDAALAAAWAAARAAAWDAAGRDAALAAAISDLNVTLESMLLAAMEYAP